MFKKHYYDSNKEKFREHRMFDVKDEDLVKFDALLIISALIIIAISFFRPLIAEMTENFEKPITKKVLK